MPRAAKMTPEQRPYDITKQLLRVRLFKDTYGETPGRYLTRRRIERSCDLLRWANLTITEICMVVGFTSLGTFCTRFKEQVGMTPTEFRARAGKDGPAPIPGCFVLFWAGAFTSESPDQDR